MNKDDFANKFFDEGKKQGYKIEKCKRGEARGLPQIVFHHKKLHLLHTYKLYSLIIERRINISRTDFESVVRGRPCAYLPFIKILKKCLINQ